MILVFTHVERPLLAEALQARIIIPLSHHALDIKQRVLSVLDCLRAKCTHRAMVRCAQASAGVNDGCIHMRMSCLPMQLSCMPGYCLPAKHGFIFSARLTQSRLTEINN